MKYPKAHSLERNESMWGWILAMPVILGFLIFTLGPMIASLVLSLTDYRPASSTIAFKGFNNYISLFRGDDVLFRKALKVTVYYVLLATPLNIVVAFLVALVMNQNVRGKTMFRCIFYLPTIVPVVATCMIWRWLMDPSMGLLNTLLRQWHLPTSQWIYAESSVIPSLSVMNVWTSGGTMIIFLAGLQGVPRSLYEAIDIDGGNVWHRFVYITVPMMTPTIFFNLIMGLINGFQSFTTAFIMTNGGPNNGSLFYVFYLYKKAFIEQQMGMACAVAWIMFVIILIVTFIVFASSGKWVFYGGDDR